MDSPGNCIISVFLLLFVACGAQLGNTNTPSATGQYDPSDNYVVHSLSPMPEMPHIPLSEVYAAYAEDRVEDETKEGGGQIEEDDPLNPRLGGALFESITKSRMLTVILQRGKELLSQLPRLLIVVGRKIIEQIPTPNDLMNCGKQILLGMPQEAIAYAIDSVCVSAVSYETVRPRVAPHPGAMNYVLWHGDNVADRVRVPLEHSERLWQHPLFRADWPVVLVITGWNSNPLQPNEALEKLYAAYRCRGEHNFVAIDTAEFVDTLYMWSAFSTRPLGRLVGEALANLTQLVSPDNVHIIGHSLGAHIGGEAGRMYQQLTNQSLGRITGLDPARPCFNEGEHLTGLQRDDAHFVDVIHSNSGILGHVRAMGDLDFYPNGKDPLQPGCYTIFCSHSRAYEYFAETVYPGQERRFEATKCHSLGAYKRGRCNGAKMPMGLLADHRNGTLPSGSYYLTTKAQSPYGSAAASDWRPMVCSRR